MAATSKKVKSRLDFGAALNEALFADDEVNNNINNEYDTTDDEDSNKNKDEPSERTQINNQINSDTPTTEIKNQENIINEPTDKVVVNETLQHASKQYTTYEDIEDDEDADMFLAIAKGSRGVQRSIYFENDVYQYIQDKSERYNVKFSNVVNLLIKEAICKNKNQK